MPRPGATVTPSGGNNELASAETSMTSSESTPTPIAASSAPSSMTPDIQPASVGITGAATPPPVNQPSSISIEPPKKKNHLNAILAAILVILVIIVAVLGVYAEVVVPNKPSSVLKDALINSIQEPNDRFNGTIEMTSGTSYKLALNGSDNKNSKAADLNINFAVAGVSIPAEARLVNGQIYFKFGDLSQLSGIVDALYPSLSTEFQTLSAQLSNKWFVIDSTLTNEADLGCYLNTGWNLNQSDINLLENMYKSNAFASIHSTNSATLNNQKVEEFHLTINNDKFSKYLNGLNSLSVIKNLKSCSKDSKDSKASLPSSTAKNNQTLAVNIWVNKSQKQVVQMYISGTGKSESGSMTMKFNYNPVAVSAPANAQSVTQLLLTLNNQLQSSGLNTSLTL